MAGKSNYLSDTVINSVLRAQAFPSVTGSVYVALFTVAPADDGTGGTEVSGGSYARIAVTRATGSWAAPSDSGGTSTTTNSAAVTFASPTANWGTVIAFGVYDALTTGNLLYSGNLTTSRTINNGDSAPNFAIGALTITES